ncbi:MAG: hypothetical protein HYX60_02935 [Legionella longbeachae]|nr:hypothetical protein [Legionella longbeachae]
MFDFFKFRNNHRGMIKTGTQGALISATFYISQIIDLQESPVKAIGSLAGLLALQLYVSSWPSTSDVIYKEAQPGTEGKENGFYLIEDNSPKF